MKKVLRKSVKERQKEESQTHRIFVGSTQCSYWFVACDSCNVAYFRGETILATEDNSWKCPNKVGKHLGLFGSKTCMNNLSGGDEKCFNKYYKLAPHTTTV